MKKAGIVVVLLLVVIALLPIIGNKTVSSEIDTRLAKLKEHGLAVKEAKESGTYMTTKKHYEFVLEDSKKFLDYLSSQYSADQIPPYVNSVLDGIVLGADVEYSNIPFFTTIMIDLYPVKFADTMTKKIEQEDPDLYKRINDFLRSKGLLYHMNYHISSDAFEGNLKDVETTFVTKNDMTMKLIIKNTKFGGVGPLVAPKESFFNMETLNLHFKNKRNGEMIVAFEGLQSEGKFESKAKYDSKVTVKGVKIVINENGDDLYFNLNNLISSYALDTKEAKTNITGMVKAENFVFKTQDVDVNVDKFNYELALLGLDAKTFEALETEVTKERANPTRNGQMKIQELIMDILAKGLEFKINTMDIENIVYNKTKKYGNVHFNADLVLKADPKLKDKVRYSPMGMIGDMEFKGLLRISESIYDELKPKLPMIQQFAKVQNNEVVFDIALKDTKLTVNGKPLQ